MFFSNEEEDQEFAPSQGGSKLASLFGIDKATSKGGNESLTYTAPKEPKKKKTVESSGASPSVVCAAAVHAYKYIEDKYTSQGKLGAALLGNPSTVDYRILLYVSKTQQVTNAKITGSFKFTIQPSNYATFYDDARQNWSIAFESEQSLFEFAKQIALAKAHCCGNNLDSVIVQDLPPLGDGGSVEIGDSIELRYNGWLLQENTCGALFDSNASSDKLLRFKVGKGKCLKALDDSSVGLKKGGKRLLVVPPKLGYGSEGKGKVPPNVSLVYEVEAVRVKLQRDKDGDTSSVTSEPPQSIPETTNETEEDFKTRSKSISEQLSQQPAKTDKAKLISRMAKMGQPMLPMTGASVAQPDSEDEPEIQTPEAAKPNIPTKPTAMSGAAVVHPPAATPSVPMEQPVHQPYMQPAMPQPVHQPAQINPMVMQGVPQTSQVALFQPQNPMQPGYQGYGQHPPQYNQMYNQGQPQQYQAPPPAPTPVPPAPQTDSSVPVLLSETRQQNTEVRLSLTRVSDKIDRMQERIEQMFNQQSSALSLTNSAPNMETSALMNTVQRIVKENEQLKKDVLEKGARIESQNEKISDLLQKNQRYIEQSNVLLEERNNTFKTTASTNQAKVLELEQEKVQLASELNTATAQIGSLQLELASLRKKESELRTQLESTITNEDQRKTDLNTLRVQNSENERKLEDSLKSLKEERQVRKHVENQVSSLEEEISDIKTERSNLEKALSERKKKSAQEKKQLEEEIEELKQQHEVEISNLKEKLRAAKLSTDVNASQQVSQLEQELNQEWKEKCDRLVGAAQDKYKLEIQEINDEKSQIEEKLHLLQAKMSSMKSSANDNEKEVLALQEQVEELKVWKQKYETLRSNAAAFKERYESRLTEVEEQRDEAEEALQKAEIERDKAVNYARKAALAAKGGVGAAGGSSQDVAAEVKKVMNAVYQELKTEFTPSKSYTGSDVQSSILKTVKSVTLKMIQSQSQKPKQVPDERNDSSEDEEESEEYVPEPPVVVEKVTKSSQEETTPGTQEKGTAKLEKTQEGPQADDDSTHKEPAYTASVPQPQSQGSLAPPKDLSKDSPKESLKDPDVEKEADMQYVHVTDLPNTDLSNSGDPNNANESKKDMEDGKPAAYITEVNSNIEEPEIMVAQSAAQTSSAAPKVEKEKSKVAPTTGDKGNPHYAEELNKAGEQSRENVLKPDTANVSGDKGNPYYAAELAGEDKEPKNNEKSPKPKSSKATDSAIFAAVEACIIPDKKTKDKDKAETEAAIIASVESMIVPQTSSQTESKKQDTKSKVVDKDIMSAVEACIVPQTSAQNLGAAPPKESCKPKETHTAMIGAVEACILPDVAASTGAKPKVKADDGKQGKKETTSAILDSVESMLLPMSDSSSSKPKQTGEAKAAMMSAVESLIVPTSDPITGDKGNPHYAKELAQSDTKSAILASVEACIIPDGADIASKTDKKDTTSKNKDSGGPIKPDVAHVTGDRGNVHYAKELEKAGKARTPVKQEEQLIAPQSASQVSSAALDGKIKQEKAPITGDKGNPEYAKELDKAGKEKDTAKLNAEKAAITGDKGNVHYAKELEKAAGESKEKLEEQMIAPQSASQVSSAAPIKIKEEKAPITGDKGNPEYTKELDKAAGKADSKIKSEKAPITGDKGNVHYAKELEKAAQESSTKATEPEVIVQRSAAQTSASALPKKEKKEEANVTGDKGNPYYAAELEKGKDKDSKTQEKMTKEEARPTGDKGNVLYAKELEKADPNYKDKDSKDEKPKTPSKESSNVGPQPDILSAIEKQIIPTLMGSDEGDSSKKDKRDKKEDTKKSDEQKKKAAAAAALFGDDGDDDPLFDTPTTRQAAQKKPASSTKAPPIFDDGDKSDEDDLFASDKKASTESKKSKSPKESKVPSKTKEAKKDHGDSDDGMKPKPPPLFGDDDDDDDLDWLS